MRNGIKSKILFGLIPIIMVGIIAISIFSYIQLTSILNDQFESQQQNAEIMIDNTIQVIDTSYKLLESELQKKLELQLQQFITAYEASNNNIDDINLSQLKEQINGELYIIDDTTTVVQSTDPSAVGFAFSSLSPSFTSLMKNIREGEKTHFERLRIDVISGSLSMWGYKPSPDHKYILEVGLNASTSKSVLSHMNPAIISNEISKNNPFIHSLRVFDPMGLEFVQEGSGKHVSEEMMVNLKKVVTEGTFTIHAPNNIIKKYIYLDLKNSNQVYMTDPSKIVEIVYDTSFIEKQKRLLALVIAIICLVVIFAVIGYVYTFSIRTIIRPIESLKKIAQGDFTNISQMKSNDEIGELAQDLNVMATNMKNLIRNIQGTSKHVLSSSEKQVAQTLQISESSSIITQSIQSIAENSSDQVAKVVTTSKNIDIFGEKLDKFSKQVLNIENSSKEANNYNSQVKETMQILHEYTNQLSHSSKKVYNAITILNQKSDHINGIIDTISNISDQTGLLSLNASIEAARAGEAGRGFAIVADEVRKLSEDTRISTEEISTLIKEIQLEVQKCVDAIKDSNTMTHKNLHIVTQMDQEINTIEKQLDSIVHDNKEIRLEMDTLIVQKEDLILALRQVSELLTESVAATEEISASVEQQTEHTNEIANFSKNLNELAKILEESISGFKI
ncbi:MAG: methyl-accepting chemotaxis protein [Marinisporobacter sp.]|nr:methyl-accepting chemotaxis protein [Marinisporobacter sp.]